MDISRFARNEKGLILDLKQGSPEWLALRQGKITGTAVHSLIGNSDSFNSVVRELVLSKVHKSKETGYKSAAMERGNLLEDDARKTFEYYYFDTRPVLEVGAVMHPRIDGFMISPDGLVQDYANLEIKCLESKNYYDHFIAYKSNPRGFSFLDPQYNSQVQAGLACSMNDHGIGVIYNPDFEGNEYIEFPIERKEVLISHIEEKAEEALYLADVTYKRYFK